MVLCSATLDAAGSLAPKSDGGKAVERQMVPSKFRIAMAILKIQWVFNSEAGCAVGAQFFVSPLRDLFDIFSCIRIDWQQRLFRGKGLAWSQVLGVFDLISTCGLQANVACAQKRSQGRSVLAVM